MNEAKTFDFGESISGMLGKVVDAGGTALSNLLASIGGKNGNAETQADNANQAATKINMNNIMLVGVVLLGGFLIYKTIKK